MTEIGNSYRILVEKPEEKTGHLGMDGWPVKYVSKTGWDVSYIHMTHIGVFS
jgi:hypothetical protein